MSNGIFTYTEEQWAALFAQFSKAMEIAREKLRPHEMVKRCLQAIISDDVVVQFTPKIIADADGGKIFHVTGNFDSAALALDAGNYQSRFGFAISAEEVANVPMAIQQVDRKVKLVPLAKMMTPPEIFEHYPKMADPMTLFTFGAVFPEKQVEGPIVMFWKDHGGKLWNAMLDSGEHGRFIVVGQEDKGLWKRECRLLICK